MLRRPLHLAPSQSPHARPGHDRVGSGCSTSAAMTAPPFEPTRPPRTASRLGHPLSRSSCATRVGVVRACRGRVEWRPCGTWHIAPHDQHSNAPAANLSHRTSQTGPAIATTADHHGPCSDGCRDTKVGPLRPRQQTSRGGRGTSETGKRESTPIATHPPPTHPCQPERAPVL